MPNSAQASKRLRQAATRNLRNRSAKSEIKTLTKKTLAAMTAGNREQAVASLRQTQARLDKAASKGILHAKTVARRKALLHRHLDAMEVASGS